MNAHPGDHRVTFGPHTWVCGSAASALLAFEALQTEHPGKALRVERCEAVGGWDEEQGVNWDGWAWAFVAETHAAGGDLGEEPQVSRFVSQPGDLQLVRPPADEVGP
jgi:hypothetical protein